MFFRKCDFMEIIELVQQIAKIPDNEKKCVQEILKAWTKSTPLLDKKVLLNCHLTNATLLLVELFISSGAEFYITATPDLVCHNDTKSVVNNMGIYVDPSELIKTPFTNKHFFDVVIDCGAYLANQLEPRYGFVELTHVDKNSYKSINCPVVSVDKSFVKKLETKYGTGDGFVRAISSLYAQTNRNHCEHSYMIFGYGKVGQGISTCLTMSGVNSKQIYIIEANESLRLKAQIDGYEAFSIYNDIKSIKEILLNETNCAVSATGKVNSLSEFFQESDFSEVEYLINMGTHDEWGLAFSYERILNQKRPYNFTLEYPTKVTYLDPIFALLACATLDLTKSKNKNQFNIDPPLVETQTTILKIWFNNQKVLDFNAFYQEEEKDILINEAYCSTR